MVLNKPRRLTLTGVALADSAVASVLTRVIGADDLHNHLAIQIVFVPVEAYWIVVTFFMTRIDTVETDTEGNQEPYSCL